MKKKYRADPRVRSANEKLFLKRHTDYFTKIKGLNHIQCNVTYGAARPSNNPYYCKILQSEQNSKLHPMSSKRVTRERISYQYQQ